MTDIEVGTYLQTVEGRRYAEFVAGLRTAIVNFSDDSEQVETEDVAKIVIDRTLSESNAVSSLIVGGNKRFQHKPVLDLDMDVMVIPSSTRGHHHLYIDHPMSWEEYSLLMDVLGHVGILQKGYVRVSHQQDASWVRTPWTRKASWTRKGY